jgi:tetratricopeptide (TPR) repeat protein
MGEWVLRRLRPGAQSGAGLLAAALLVAGFGCSRDDPLERARAFQARGANEEVVEELRTYLAKHPDHPEANFRLGVAFYDLGRPVEAIFPLRKAAASEEYSLEGGLRFAAALFATDNNEQALAALDRVLELQPDNLGALTLRAEANLRLHRGEPALEAAARLVALQPEQLLWRLLRAKALAESERLDEADEAFGQLIDADWGRNTQGAENACLARAHFLREQREAPDETLEALQVCVERHPRSLQIPLQGAVLLDEIERVEDAMALLRAALERNPGAPGLRQALAQRLVANDRLEEAEALLAAQAEADEGVESWLALSTLRRQAGNLEGGLEAAVSARESATADSSRELAILVEAELLVDLGRVDEAEQVSRELEDELYRNVIRGRLAHARGAPEPALEFYSKALPYWPDNYGLRVYAALAALDLGRDSRAMEELQEATRQGPTETDAALWLARLYFVRGDYQAAYEMAQRHIAQRGVNGPEGHFLAAQALQYSGRLEESLRVLDNLAERRDGEFAAQAYAETGRVLTRSRGAEAGLAALTAFVEERQLDLTEPRNEPLLWQIAQSLVDLGRYEEGLRLVDGLLAQQAEAPALLAFRGRLELLAGQREAADASFARALELDLNNAPALAGRSHLLRARGDAEGALEWMERAVAAAPDVPDYPYMAARLSLDRGDTEEGTERLERVLRRHPGFAPAANDLAWQLAVEGRDLERAEALARLAQRMQPGPETLDTLGFVALQRGQFEAAIRAFERVLELRPEYATARYHLALALEQNGSPQGAVESLRAALEYPFPEASEARRVLARLEAAEAAPAE